MTLKYIDRKGTNILGSNLDKEMQKIVLHSTGFLTRPSVLGGDWCPPRQGAQCFQVGRGQVSLVEWGIEEGCKIPVYVQRFFYLLTLVRMKRLLKRE